MAENGAERMAEEIAGGNEARCPYSRRQKIQGQESLPADSAHPHRERRYIANPVDEPEGQYKAGIITFEPTQCGLDAVSPTCLRIRSETRSLPSKSPHRVITRPLPPATEAVKEEVRGAAREAPPHSLLRSLAGSAVATARRTAAPPPCPPRPAGGVQAAVKRRRPAARRFSSCRSASWWARRSALADLSTICVTIGAAAGTALTRPVATGSLAAVSDQQGPAGGSRVEVGREIWHSGVGRG